MAVQETEKKQRYLRVKVVDTGEAGRAPVSIRIPIGVLNFGMKMAQAFSPEVKDVKVDWDELATSIEHGAIGELVHVEDEQEHRTVEVWVD